MKLQLCPQTWKKFRKIAYLLVEQKSGATTAEIASRCCFVCAVAYSGASHKFEANSNSNSQQRTD